MQYNEFGKMKKMVSRFGLGCMRLPQMKNAEGKDIIDENESIKIIRHAVDNGVNYLDTAYTYPGSEEVLGKALKDGYREKVLIATKAPAVNVKSSDDYPRFFNEQLKRLQTDYIDVYIFHCLDRANWETVKKTDGIKFMEQMKSEGKIKEIGFSFHSDYELFEEIVDAYCWDMCLIQLNILDRNHQAGVKGLKYAAEKGISVVIMEPLKGGLLANNQPQEISGLLNGYKEQRSLVEWAFRWLYDQREAKVILSGVNSMAQLEDNLRIFKDAQAGVMSEQDIKLMDKVKAIYESKVKVGCTGCGYCMPCPMGVNIPEIFKVYNDAHFSPWSEFGKTFYSLIATASGKDASNCVGCKKCQNHCPQNINIVDMLKEAHEFMKR